MYSQNCGYLPSKKQSPFAGALPHSLGLLRNFTTKKFPKLEESTIPNMQFETANQEHSAIKTTNIVDFVTNFYDPSKGFKNSIPNIQLEKERHHRHCKELIDQLNYNTMPLMSTHLIGGFVGSKSQLGRRPTHRFGINMWDIIRELFVLAGKSDVSPKCEVEEHLLSKDYCSCDKINNDPSGCIDKKKNYNSLESNSSRVSKNDRKQSYAEVAKLKLPVPPPPPTNSMKINDENINEHNTCFIEESNLPKSVIISRSICTNNRPKSPVRDRITSECSADSEDSFIVFENCEGEYESFEEDSDDESVVSSKTLEESSSECGSPGSIFFGTCGPQFKKKVRFAEGKGLTQVHPMVTWGYAYRSARRGPWEMLARDSERFKHRIAATEAILQPILDPVHRESIFHQRFADHS